MKKVFILEDNPEAMAIVDWLKNMHSLNVIHAKSVEDTVYYLEYDKENPIDSYDYFIFDAHVPGASCDSVTGERLHFSDPNGLNGISLLQRYKPQIEKSNSKICIFSAYYDLINLYYHDLLSEVCLIDKCSESFIKDLTDFLSDND